MISLVNVTKSFGGLTAVSQVSFDVEKGGIFSIIGPNGAGKTTIFNLITGIYEPTEGKINLNGRDITGLKPYQINRSGISRTFQNIRLFPELTVAENIQVGQRTSHSNKENLFFSFNREEKKKRQLEMAEIIEFMGLQDLRNIYAREIPYGFQRRLEIARALASRPDLLLLDEPSCGMNEEETKSLMKDIEKIRSRGCTILLVEHDMDVVMGLSDRIVVLNFGRKIAEGRPLEIQNNPQVQEAYLGSD